MQKQETGKFSLFFTEVPLRLFSIQYSRTRQERRDKGYSCWIYMCLAIYSLYVTMPVIVIKQLYPVGGAVGFMVQYDGKLRTIPYIS